MPSRNDRTRKMTWRTLAMLACFSAPLHAEPTGAERAAAEALFDSATELMTAEKFAAACEKFEGSLDLDPALGTMLRLGDCYDRVGKSASAWAMFRDAASLAHNRNETLREQMATERASDLEKRLSRVRFKVEPGAGLELTLRVGNTRIPAAMFGAAVPLDPGVQVVEASATGRRTWSTSVEVAVGPALQVVQIPKLEVAGLSSAPSAGAARDTKPPIAPSSGGGAQRALGYVSSGVGLVALGLGGFLTYRAKTVNKHSLQHCRANDTTACSAEGVSERQDAQKLASGAFASFAGGGALLAGGALLLLLAPHREGDGAEPRGVTVSAALGPSGGGVVWTNRW